MKKLLYSECIFLMSWVLHEHRARCRLTPALLLSPRNQSSNTVRSISLSKSTLGHDTVAAAVLHKHHSIVRVCAGLIQHIYSSHSKRDHGSSITEIHQFFAGFFTLNQVACICLHTSMKRTRCIIVRCSSPVLRCLVSWFCLSLPAFSFLITPLCVFHQPLTRCFLHQLHQQCVTSSSASPHSVCRLHIPGPLPLLTIPPVRCHSTADPSWKGRVGTLAHNAMLEVWEGSREGHVGLHLTLQRCRVSEGLKEAGQCYCLLFRASCNGLDWNKNHKISSIDTRS